MKIVTVLGARPQFIKAAPVSKALAEAGLDEILVHTGQHYDANMSSVFFDELGMRPPAYTLETGGGSRMSQVSRGLAQLEEILIKEKPDRVLVYGDTNATFSGAFAAVAHNIPLAHVEAGLRSFNRRMPEETNRILTDHVAQWCFTPTPEATQQLAKEGITGHWVGDVMLDALLQFSPTAQEHASWVALKNQHGLEKNSYVLLTMHRAESTDKPDVLRDLFKTLNNSGHRVLFPVHPRTKPLWKAIVEETPLANIIPVEPLGYLAMLAAESNASAIVTDSGGVQKEAAMLGVPCLTLRTETEWVETVAWGVNQVIGLDAEKLSSALAALQTNAPVAVSLQTIHQYYGSGHASQRIVALLQGND
ncbi:MAG: UDP-N-acetylglucosamine 2-epimerase (non-hydrolyzing) [Vampirovibrionales bacterium]|nr:UDP-N-acetylglucosamine 2-epimerase (non-hydrolyzing) [Vampirovibrionales bacterium]